MKRHEYTYMGLYNNNRIFYDEIKKELYVGKKTYNGSLGQASIFAFVSVSLYGIGRKIILESMNFPIMPYVIVSAIIGVVLAVVCSKRVDSANEAFFTHCEAFVISDKSDWKKLLRQSRNVTIGYIYLKIILFLLVVFQPMLARELKNPILFIGYFITWFAFIYMFLQFNLRKRLKIISELKKDII